LAWQKIGSMDAISNVRRVQSMRMLLCCACMYVHVRSMCTHAHHAASPHRACAHMHE
jgi:hypothetical protein